MCSGGVRGITVLCHLSRCSTAILISVNSTKTSSVGPMRPCFVATCATAAGRSSAKCWSPFCISRPADHGVCPSDYVRPTEQPLCEPALCVESLTVRPCGEKDGKGIVNSSLFPRGLRSWRTQSAGPAIMSPTPALTAARAPRSLWPRPSTPSTADGERSSLGLSHPGPLLPPLNPGSSSNPARTIVR